ncbi:MAG TPA: MobF family relaxase [Euzebyales bacterium]|nr:MobF family relaxase [Euzebyales bacterium]
MLNIGKLAGVDSVDYYLSQVASGVEDYYLGNGEAPGQWTGTAAPDLSLHGEVKAETLRRVLGGHDAAGKPLKGLRSSRKIPGFDLAFRAPKSVSLLWALGGHDVASDVHDAHDAAVAAALAYLEDHAGWTRRGAGGRHAVKGRGLVAAAFRHRASRDRDPLLHTHVLVANAVQADDGRWGTLDATRLYRHAKAAGYLYQTQLRHELTRRLGVAWNPVAQGVADLTGVPDPLIRAFVARVFVGQRVPASVPHRPLREPSWPHTAHVTPRATMLRGRSARRGPSWMSPPGSRRTDAPGSRPTISSRRRSSRRMPPTGP